MIMKKASAIGILTTMFMGLIGWASTNIIDNQVQIRENKSNISRDHEQLNRMEKKLDRILDKI
jgi:hypothetical protein